MENAVNIYCRFCAKLKSPNEVLNLQNDGEKCDDVLLKLAFLNALYVDVNNDSLLPKTVCFVCYDSLNKAYEFLDRVKESQAILSSLLSAANENKNCTSDDDRNDHFDDVSLHSDAEDCVRQESPKRSASAPDDNIYSEVTIKEEPTEEIPDLSVIQDCNIQLDTQDNLSCHTLIELLQKPNKQHVQCGEISKNKDSLQCHLQEFTLVKRKCRPLRKPDKPITIEDRTCPMCKKVYKNPSCLRKHMKLHKEDREKNYTCDRCGKMFYDKSTLKSHIYTHDKIRPHVCRICNKAFLFAHRLRSHVEMHYNVKPFSCEQCGKCFRLQYQLNKHKIVHTDSMPYVCKICNKAFRVKEFLKNHQLQHTGARPYSCSHCGMEFTNWPNYNKHMKRRHGMDTSKKKITPKGIFPFNPETGQIVQDQDPIGTEEWKKKIMIPANSCKKKIKAKSTDS